MTPNDPLYPNQWHFSLLGDIETIWDEYTGAGVRVGIYDDGVEASHEDLSANYDESLEWSGDDGLPNTAADGHGTSVAGLIGAARNGLGGVGVAYDVTMAAIDFINDVQTNPSNTTAAFQHAAGAFDIISNSWGSPPSYDSSLDIGDPGTGADLLASAFRDIALNGRGGLGTVITLAAGNEANDSTLQNNYGILGNAQGDGLNSLFESITVAATDQAGAVTYYSNYGANILVAAPAASVTTDRSGNDGYDPGNYTTTFGGTSAATPVTSGVIALMLEANPDLGWRDVQNILAMSAAQTGSAYGAAASGYEVEAWTANGAGNWNGGGMTFNRSYGYGMVDAFAAVRMAEAWSLMNPTAATTANEQTVTASYGGSAVAINDNSTVQITVSVTNDIDIEHLYVTIAGSHSYFGDLTFTLIAPDGTRSELMARELGGTVFSGDYTFGLTGLRGMSSAGDWILEVSDSETLDTGSITGVDLEFMGSASSSDTQWHFTDDFLALAGVDATRQTITDSDGGTDWLNFAAIAQDVTLSMVTNGDVSVGGTHWATIGNSAIENLVLGDGNDTAYGNGLGNAMYGMRGDDHLTGRQGADMLDGGAGNDFLNGEFLDPAYDLTYARVFRLYQATLDRAPDLAGLVHWAGQLAGGQALEDIATGFIASTEFQNAYGSTDNTQFVTLLYQNVLNRAPDAAGQAHWVGLLDDGSLSREQVVLGFSESAEFITNTAGTSLEYSWVGLQSSWADDVFRLYQATLDRAPDLGGLANWTGQLAGGQALVDIATGFIASTEFQNAYGATDNTQFVTLLYQNVLNRAPDAGGQAHWVGLLDDGSLSREQVVLGFSQSAEFVGASWDNLVAYMRGLGMDDRLDGGTGDNTLFGGWRADTFVFDATEAATDTVIGLEAWDVIELQNSTFAGATDAIGALSQTADGVTLVDGATTIMFHDSSLGDFSTDMFVFV